MHLLKPHSNSPPNKNNETWMIKVEIMHNSREKLSFVKIYKGEDLSVVSVGKYKSKYLNIINILLQ